MILLQIVIYVQLEMFNFVLCRNEVEIFFKHYHLQIKKDYI